MVFENNFHTIKYYRSQQKSICIAMSFGSNMLITSNHFKVYGNSPNTFQTYEYMLRKSQHHWPSILTCDPISVPNLIVIVQGSINMAFIDMELPWYTKKNAISEIGKCSKIRTLINITAKSKKETNMNKNNHENSKTLEIKPEFLGA